MKALVIGGNRFFGKRLVRLLLDQGISVTLLNRGQFDDGFGNQVTRIKFDRRELKRNHPAISNQKWDIIFDQVCYDAFEAESACKTFAGRTKKYIFTSTASVYDPGQSIREAAFDPSTYKTIDRDKDYGEAKRQAEVAFFRQDAFPVTAVRFPVVLGEDDYTERLKFHIEHIKNEKPIYFPNIKAKKSFVYAADAAAFLAFLVQKDFHGPVNCCSDEPIALRDLISLIEESVKKQSTLVPTETLGDHSPYGIKDDWYMNTQRLHQLGFHAQPIMKWLPQLIQNISAT